MDSETLIPEPEKTPVDILFIAGEHSGDQHAALIVKDLLAVRPDLNVTAVGGPSLKAAGAQLLYDLTQESVVGLIEVLRHYKSFKRLFDSLLSWVAQHRPKVVVLVDYPGFNLRFADALRKAGISRKGGGSVILYQYVSPQIWAWKAKRRFKMARFLDEVGAIFPFEVDCYADTDLPVYFVGHPFVREGYANPLQYNRDAPVLLLPGSRRQAVERIFPVLLDAVEAYRSRGGQRSFVTLYPEDSIRELLRAQLVARPGLDSRVRLVPVEEGTAASAVLTSSGTMSLICALAGLPGAIVYRAHPLTAWIGRRLIRIQWLGIANLVLGETLYPEYLQQDADAGVLADLLLNIEAEPALHSDFIAGGARLKEILATSSSATVAHRLESLMDSSPTE